MSTINQVNKTVEKTIKDALAVALESYSEAIAGDKRWKELKKLVPDCTELVFQGDDSGNDDGDGRYTVWSPLYTGDAVNFDPDDYGETEEDLTDEQSSQVEEDFRESFQISSASNCDWNGDPKDEKLFQDIVKTVSAKDYVTFCELYQELVEEVTDGVGNFLPEETFRIKVG
jgi:hypothetical protein